ncbi:pilus assembly protein PilY [Geomonas nitrogeniifigens]|uniref:Pilus assembly protein PilY n=1 Tax=Geomonas diazotrophica TaxID=2843197 RepID=A0ABX8JFX5_9BACT|nr:PilC/PilY family type IV pilus protein [Geomonas nitrogeniifigens]QWV96046.1 pilus assembly protein PilY [Geomonas nitrogeniifigens]QXE85114.1 pilus assembly protein PilY [Geomonas nitrogeniifigens]
MGKTLNRLLIKNLPLLILTAMLLPGAALAADPGDNWCITPPFITGGIKPNLLLMIDNSASMYDLGYIAGSTSAAPTYTCGTGAGSATVSSSYCFDNTYDDTKDYEGYFSKLNSDGTFTYPVYQYSGGKFVEINTGVPTTTGTGIYRTSYVYIAMSGDNTVTPPTRVIDTFIASGKFLNWLAASKFDIEKKILTGGKYVSGSSLLQGETRGCVGRRFVKVVPAISGLSFAVRGPTAVEPNYDPSTQGGGTRIEIFEGTYNQSDCQCAVYNWSNGNYGQASTDTKNCLDTTNADNALATINHTQQACWKIKDNIRTGGDIWQGVSVNSLQTACANVYSDPKTPIAPAALTDESSGNYICTSAATHSAPVAPYIGTSSDTTGFMGKCWRNNSDKWLNDGDTCVKNEILHYCMGQNFAEVTDPSSVIPTSGNIPSVLMDAGVRAIGSPVGPAGKPGYCSRRTTTTCSTDADCSTKVCSNAPATTCTSNSDCTSPGTCVPQTCNNPFYGKVGVSSAPTGLINDFASSIRFGVMSFNNYGSATECGSTVGMPCPKFCSGNQNKMCSTDSDCLSSLSEGTCQAATNKDASKVLDHIGTAVGDHSSGLINTIDGIPAVSWTPFAEAFYNAIAYFVKDATATTATLNSTKFTPTTAAIQEPLTGTDDYTNHNPIQFRCQQNNVMLITDGTSTADKNDTMRNKVTDSSGYFRDPNTLAESGSTSGVCGSYAGSPYIHDLSYFAYHRNLFDPSQVCHGTGATACENAQTIKTHVVYNAPSSTGTTNVCDPYVQMNMTAVNGGTTLHNPNNPTQLRTELKAALESIAAGASSGTAASILSNSEGSGANILQAVFYPKKVFYNQTEASWIGEMQNLWYYVDPQVNRSTIREDTDQNNAFDLIADKVVSFRFDPTDNVTYAYVSQDTNGDGAGDTAETKEDSDDVLSIWRAGKTLWQRPLTGTGARPRKIYTSTNGTSLIQFSSATFPNTGGGNNANTLASYLDVSTTDAPTLIDYVHGLEETGYRSRTVSILNKSTNVASSGVWRLGDIISSTPRIQSNLRLNGYNLQPPSGYSDTSYTSYIQSSDYHNRGMVYVGGNDGMLHAFNFGLLNVTASGTQKATLSKLSNSDPALGEEMWAYIPKQALPYLKYFGDPKYNHLYYVDGPTLLLDASIGAPSGVSGCNATSYWNCTKLTSVVDGANSLDGSANPWRSILIGSMGIGGASSSSCSTPSTSNCVPTPRTDPSDTSKGLGFSTYFALDVSDPKNPSLMWEFNRAADNDLGFATTGPAIVRVGDRAKNGRWFAIFGSGPTGPIDTDGNQFQGRSNQNLKFFVVDLKTGEMVRAIDTEIAEAFAGSMMGGAIDADRWDSSANGFYQDDAVFAGYTKKVAGTPATWTDGGVIRIVTHNDTDPAHWTWSKVIEGTGPVVTSIARLQDRKNKKLWLYFGSGRYYYRSGTDIDDYSTRRWIYGVKEPCYNTSNLPGNIYDASCSTTVALGDVTDQSTSISSSVGSGGWKIQLDASTTAFGAERVVSDAVTLTNGTVFVTTFEPTSDACGFGGNSFLWALGYDTGGRPSDAALAGKALIQLSTGEFKEVDLAQAFGSGASRLMRRTTTPMTGKPPADAFPVVSKSANKPVKRIMHIQER